MTIQLTVYDNGDHTCLVWLPSDGKAIPGCRGFTIERTKNGHPEYLHGVVGFSDQDKLDPNATWKFPLQRFMWWDYFVQLGDKVRYAVVPVIGTASDLVLDQSNASQVTPEMTITGQVSPHMSAFFNRGIVATQWVTRALAKYPANSKIKSLVATKGDPLRNDLSGQLRPQILQLLAEAKKDKGVIYAALYELNDPELIPALTALGKNCNLILGNGAFKSNTSPNNDENADVRKQLKGKVSLSSRIVKLGHFAHNKFVVFCDSKGTPQRVLTGSTNWTSSGLCTQANNALLIDDADVAADFKAAWMRLKAAGNDYPTALVKENSTANPHQVDGCKITPWFVKTSAAQDLVYARKLINAAKDGLLFLFFNPGTFQADPSHWTLLQNVLERHNAQNTEIFDPNLYFCGVVNQDIPQLTTGAVGPTKGAKQSDVVLDPSTPAPVTLYKSGLEAPQRLSHDVLVPRAIKDKFHFWERELLGASMVNIHSKVIVIDPFGANPVVMTGSHNLGFKASNANDDNLVVIEGNGPLAAAYAINIVAIYQNYRWNSYVEAHRNDPKVWHGLVDNDQWQQGYLAGTQLDEIKFWMAGASKASAGSAASEGASPISARDREAIAPKIHAVSST